MSRAVNQLSTTISLVCIVALLAFGFSVSFESLFGVTIVDPATIVRVRGGQQQSCWADSSQTLCQPSSLVNCSHSPCTIQGGFGGGVWVCPTGTNATVPVASFPWGDQAIKALSGYDDYILGNPVLCSQQKACSGCTTTPPPGAASPVCVLPPTAPVVRDDYFRESWATGKTCPPNYP
jgi:hypothetical protein